MRKGRKERGGEKKDVGGRRKEVRRERVGEGAGRELWGCG